MMVRRGTIEVAKTVMEVAEVALTAVECCHKYNQPHEHHDSQIDNTTPLEEEELESLRSENRRLKNLLEDNLKLLQNLSESTCLLPECPPDVRLLIHSFKLFNYVLQSTFILLIIICLIWFIPKFLSLNLVSNVNCKFKPSGSYYCINFFGLINYPYFLFLFFLWKKKRSFKLFWCIIQYNYICIIDIVCVLCGWDREDLLWFGIIAVSKFEVGHVLLKFNIVDQKASII